MQKFSIPKSQWLLFTSLYTTQFVGLGFMMVALIGILRSRGAELADLSIVYLINVPWILKFLWAPFIDRFGYKKWGHYRSWLLILQLFMVMILLFISQLSLDNDLNLIVVLGIVFATFSSSQDVAVDALASTEFNHHQRGMVNGIQLAGDLLGNMIGGGLVLILYPYIGWQGAFYLMAAVTSISWFQLLFFREEHLICAEKALPVAQTFKRLLVFWRGKSLWFLLVFSGTIGFSMIYAILTPMMLDAGKTLAEVGIAINIFGMGIGIFAGLLGGLVIQRLGRKLALQRFYLLQIVCFTAILPLAFVMNNITLYFALLIYSIIYPLVVSIMTTLMMDYAAQNNTPGTDYTIQYTLSLFASMLMGGLAMQIAQHFGYLGVMIVAISTAFFALILALIYAKNYLNTFSLG